MKNLKNLLAAIILLSTLTTTILTASTSNEIEINYCSEDVTVLTLRIPAAGIDVDIELLQSTFDAPVIIELEGGNDLVTIEIDGITGLIHSDGINTLRIESDGINALINSDGINTLRIESDGINPLINSDGINTLITGQGINTLINSDGINTRVSQSGVVLFSKNF